MALIRLLIALQRRALLLFSLLFFHQAQAIRDAGRMRADDDQSCVFDYEALANPSHNLSRIYQEPYAQEQKKVLSRGSSNSSRRLQALLEDPDRLQSKVADLGIKIAGYSAPMSRTLSGDFLNVVRHESGKLSFFIGDVKHHGNRSGNDSLWLHRYMQSQNFREQLGKHEDAVGIMKHLDARLRTIKEESIKTAHERSKSYRNKAARLRKTGQNAQAKEYEERALMEEEAFLDETSFLDPTEDSTYSMLKAKEAAIAAKEAALQRVEQHRAEWSRKYVNEEIATRQAKMRIADFRAMAQAFRKTGQNAEADTLDRIVDLESDAFLGSQIYSSKEWDRAFEAGKKKAVEDLRRMARRVPPSKAHMGLTHVLYDPKSRKLRYATGGGMPDLFIKKADGRVLRLNHGAGAYLGKTGFGYKDVHGELVLDEPLSKGDVLILMSDGVTDSEEQGPLLRQLLALPRGESPAGRIALPSSISEMSRLIRKETFSQDDDASVMIVELP